MSALQNFYAADDAVWQSESANAMVARPAQRAAQHDKHTADSLHDKRIRQLRVPFVSKKSRRFLPSFCCGAPDLRVLLLRAGFAH